MDIFQGGTLAKIFNSILETKNVDKSSNLGKFHFFIFSETENVDETSPFRENPEHFHDFCFFETEIRENVDKF